MIFLYLLILITGLIPLWKTIRLIRLEEKIRKNGLSTTGIVSSIQTKKIYRGPTACRVYVSYMNTHNGQRQEASFITRPHTYQPGQSIALQYLPEKPDKIIVSPKRAYWPMLLFSLLLALFVCFAVYKIDRMLTV